LPNPNAIALVLMLFGGAALFLVARAGYLRLVFGTAARSHLVTIALELDRSGWQVLPT